MPKFRWILRPSEKQFSGGWQTLDSLPLLVSRGLACMQIENVQRRATKLGKKIYNIWATQNAWNILDCHHFNTEDCRTDIVETFKILNNIDKVQHEHIFPISRTATRGHNQKIYKKNCRTNIRKYSFSQKIVNM
jgi:hypothetical protein